MAMLNCNNNSITIIELFMKKMTELTEKERQNCFLKEHEEE